MSLHKIIKIVAAILGLAGIIFLIMIIAKGDEAIKAAALDGDTSAVDPIALTAYLMLGIVLVFVIFFVIQNLITHPHTLKTALIGAGAFFLVLIIAYAVSGGDTTDYFYNNIKATDAESRMVGAGLIAFYILIVVAALSMLFAGAKKMIK